MQTRSPQLIPMVARAFAGFCVGLVEALPQGLVNTIDMSSHCSQPWTCLLFPGLLLINVLSIPFESAYKWAYDSYEAIDRQSETQTLLSNGEESYSRDEDRSPALHYERLIQEFEISQASVTSSDNDEKSSERSLLKTIEIQQDEHSDLQREAVTPLRNRTVLSLLRKQGEEASTEEMKMAQSGNEPVEIVINKAEPLPVPALKSALKQKGQQAKPKRTVYFIDEVNASTYSQTGNGELVNVALVQPSVY